MDDAYSPYKALRHLDVLQAAREGRAARPVHVQLILANLCNQRCAWCAYRDATYSSNQLFDDRLLMPTEKALEILQDCAALGTRGVQFTGGGEPTVHPAFARVFGYAHDLGLGTALVSNGVNIRRKHLADTVARSAWVRISLDAATATTYADTRSVPVSHFADACRAIAEVREARDRLGTGCVLGVGFVVHPGNWREVDAAAALARDCGADNIRISAQFSAQDERLFAGIHEDAARACRAAEKHATEEFQVYNRFGARLEDLRQRRPDYARCGYQFLTTYIGADLDVYRCCVQSYNHRGLIGSLREARFADVWMDDARARAMRSFDARDCDRCQFNNINRLLDFAIRTDEPLHSAFV